MGLISDRRQASDLFTRFGPVIHLRDADSCGVARGLVLRLAEREELVRIAKSAFVPAGTWSEGSEWERFRLRAIGFALCIAADAHLTGPAAAALIGLPTLWKPPDLPTAIRPGDPHIGHDRSPFGKIRHGYLPAFHRTTRDRVRTVSPAFAAIDVARHQGPIDGLVTADAVLRRGVDRAALFDLIGNMTAYPGMATALWVAQHADPRSESPLESLGRFSFLTAKLPVPLSNVWVRTDRQWFRVDHLIPDTGVIIEADGALKYNNRPDADVVVTAQTVREELLRRAGFAIARYNWSDAVSRPWIIPRRAHEAAALRRVGPPPKCWQLDPPRG